jgi:hypothetical protein
LAERGISAITRVDAVSGSDEAIIADVKRGAVFRLHSIFVCESLIGAERAGVRIEAAGEHEFAQKGLVIAVSARIRTWADDIHVSQQRNGITPERCALIGMLPHIAAVIDTENDRLLRTRDARLFFPRAASDEPR